MSLGGIRDREHAKFVEKNGKTQVMVTDECLLDGQISDGGGDGSGPSEGISLDYSGSTNPGTEETLITTAVPAGKTRYLSKVVVVSSTRGCFTIEAGGSVIASGRTGAGDRNAFFLWSPRRHIAEGVTIEVKHTAASETPTSDIEAYLMATDT